MQKASRSHITWSGVISFFFASLFFIQCADEEFLLSETDLATTAAANADCGCTYTIPVSTNTIYFDGLKQGIKPGAVICLKGGATYKNIVFTNIKGTASAPITIRNCGGRVTFNATGTYYGIKTRQSSYFRITGGSGADYGIKINGGQHSITLEYLSTNVEVDHVEIAGSGFSGIMAKTDPTCDNVTNRGYFVMKDVRLHHNYVHETAGEGFYVGHSFWTNGMKLSCGVRYPHAMEGVKIYNNIVKNSGWEAIQVGSSPKGAEVFNNRIENYGTKNVANQNHGVQFGEGAPGKFYGNYINKGKGNGLIIMGNADNFIHNNVIVNAGRDGIFCEDRTTGKGFRIINNTIINPGANGIRLYSEMVTMNNVLNNIIVNPGSYSTYKYPRTGNDAYVYLLNKTVKIQSLNNYFTRDINAVKFVSPSASNFALTGSSPAVNKGTSIALYNILVDHALKPRLKGIAYDIGAYEFQ